MKTSERMREFSYDDNYAYVYADEVALLEDVVEILSDALGAPIFVDNEVFSLDEIRSWVRRYVAWTMRRIDALAKLEEHKKGEES